MGAALISMVCNVTLGKKGFEAVESELRDVLAGAESLRARLTAMVAEDIGAFGALMKAYRMPKATDADKTARTHAIQAGLRGATETPLDCARACAGVIALSRRAAEQGFSGVISDAGVGVLAANTALRGAALNVQTNAPMLEDRDFAARSIAEVDRLLADSERASEAVFSIVLGRLG
jgi:formiminotetrahydrofolate cyclodeaminase